jgi:hypothetical protein
MAIEISNIISHLRERGFLPAVQRLGYNVPTTTALAVVDALGKQMNPAFVIDDENRWAYTQLVKWLFGDATMQAKDPDTGAVVAGRLNAGIYLAGRTGSGKSWALNILQMLARAYNVQVSLNGVQRCIFWDAVRADQICDQYATSGDLKSYKRAGVLCIQDLGAEPAETLYMGNRLQPAQQVIEYRGDAGGVITLFSSNLPMSHKMLVDRYGDRVASRLREMCNYIELNGKDRRKC